MTVDPIAMPGTEAALPAAPPVQAAPAGPARVLYLGGIGRSGSTLLERMIAQIPGTWSLGEVVHLWTRGIRDNERCGCGESFHACAFWTGIGQTAFGGWGNVDVERMEALAAQVDEIKYTPYLLGRTGPRGFRSALAEYAEAYRKVYDATRALTGAEVVIDSSKHTSLAYVLRQAPGIDVQLLHMVRDSRGVAYSWTKKVRRPEVTSSESYMPVFSPARIAVLWAGHNVLLELPRVLGTPTKLLRYEEFAQDPKAMLAAVQEFAKLPSGGSTLDFLDGDQVDLGINHTVAGNPMRFTSGRIAVTCDEEWRTALPRKDRRTVTALTAPVAALLGYPRAPIGGRR
ncbi:MAG: sulfotransferase [Actinomycetia bacterium]|nr:sulfotransferase [Actinomycetes bacterium]MDQ1658574.1 hypothetical protein [Cryptosporangiaceae bacterium]